MAENQLNKLTALLETGATFVVKQAAAEQLGRLVKNHPQLTWQIVLKVLEFSAIFS